MKSAEPNIQQSLEISNTRLQLSSKLMLGGAAITVASAAVFYADPFTTGDTLISLAPSIIVGGCLANSQHNAISLFLSGSLMTLGGRYMTSRTLEIADARKRKSEEREVEKKYLDTLLIQQRSMDKSAFFNSIEMMEAHGTTKFDTPNLFSKDFIQNRPYLKNLAPQMDEWQIDAFATMKSFNRRNEQLIKEETELTNLQNLIEKHFSNKESLLLNKAAQMVEILKGARRLEGQDSSSKKFFAEEIKTFRNEVKVLEHIKKECGKIMPSLEALKGITVTSEVEQSLQDAYKKLAQMEKDFVVDFGLHVLNGFQLWHWSSPWWRLKDVMQNLQKAEMSTFKATRAVLANTADKKLIVDLEKIDTCISEINAAEESKMRALNKVSNIDTDSRVTYPSFVAFIEATEIMSFKIIAGLEDLTAKIGLHSDVIESEKRTPSKSSKGQDQELFEVEYFTLSEKKHKALPVDVTVMRALALAYPATAVMYKLDLLDKASVIKFTDASLPLAVGTTAFLLESIQFLQLNAKSAYEAGAVAYASSTAGGVAYAIGSTAGAGSIAAFAAAAGAVAGSIAAFGTVGTVGSAAGGAIDGAISGAVTALLLLRQKNTAQQRAKEIKAAKQWTNMAKQIAKATDEQYKVWEKELEAAKHLAKVAHQRTKKKEGEKWRKVAKAADEWVNAIRKDAAIVSPLNKSEVIKAEAWAKTIESNLKRLQEIQSPHNCQSLHKILLELQGSVLPGYASQWSNEWQDLSEGFSSVASKVRSGEYPSVRWKQGIKVLKEAIKTEREAIKTEREAIKERNAREDLWKIVSPSLKIPKDTIKLEVTDVAKVEEWEAERWEKAAEQKTKNEGERWKFAVEKAQKWLAAVKLKNELEEELRTASIRELKTEEALQEAEEVDREAEEVAREAEEVAREAEEVAREAKEVAREAQIVTASRSALNAELSTAREWTGSPQSERNRTLCIGTEIETARLWSSACSETAEEVDIESSSTLNAELRTAMNWHSCFKQVPDSFLDIKSSSALNAELRTAMNWHSCFKQVPDSFLFTKLQVRQTLCQIVSKELEETYEKDPGGYQKEDEQPPWSFEPTGDAHGAPGAGNDGHGSGQVDAEQTPMGAPSIEEGGA